MAEIGYPGIEEHKTLHKIFCLHAEGNLRRIEKGELILDRQIMKEMLDWLQNHILTEDKKYAAAAV